MVCQGDRHEGAEFSDMSVGQLQTRSHSDAQVIGLSRFSLLPALWPLGKDRSLHYLYVSFRVTRVGLLIKVGQSLPRVSDWSSGVCKVQPGPAVLSLPGEPVVQPVGAGILTTRG